MIALILLSLQVMANPVLDRLESPVAAAHRGGLHKVSHNTLENFSIALDAGVQVIEMDLRLSADGVPVVYHDETLETQTGCRGAIAETSWDVIKNCKYSGSSHKVPSFEEAILFIDKKAIINAEFKTAPVIRPALAVYKHYRGEDWMYFQVNAELDKYAEARSVDKDVALLYKPRNEDEMKWLEASNDPNIIVVHFDKEFVTQSNIDRAHRLGKLTSVNSWKWDLLEERFSARCKKVFDLGIDIAVSNNPKSCAEQSHRL